MSVRNQLTPIGQTLVWEGKDGGQVIHLIVDLIGSLDDH